MTRHDHASPAQTTLGSEPEATFANSISSLGTRFADWVATAADYYTAAATYQQLSRLSEAELQRRGFSRATLASDICQACDRGNLVTGSPPRPWRRRRDPEKV